MAKQLTGLRPGSLGWVVGAAALAAIHGRADFSYSVSHDLRAPLRSIDGFSRVLLTRYAAALDAEGQDLLGRVHQETGRMRQLIDEMLALAQVGRIELRRSPVDLTALARTIGDRLRAHQPERRVALEIAPDLQVDADPGLLRAALENLLGNAWKYTSKNPTARIEVGQVPDHGETAYFVRDDGAGFDPAFAHKLFGAFQRLHSREEFEGTGVGLATVRRIVERHGGRVWAEGAVGRGATFYFTLGPPRG